MVLDTLQLSKDLQPAFDPEQAEALSRAMATVVAGGDHATKSDVVALKTEISTLHTEVKTEIATVKGDVTTQLATFKVEVIRWIVGAIAFNVLATAGLIILLVRTLAH